MRKMYSGNQSSGFLIARIIGFQSYKLNPNLLDKIQLRALQGAEVDCSGLVYGYEVVVFPMAQKIYVVVPCYKHQRVPTKLWKE